MVRADALLAAEVMNLTKRNDASGTIDAFFDRDHVTAICNTLLALVALQFGRIVVRFDWRIHPLSA